MAQILFRFTLSNDTYGVKQISEPDGWNNIKIILERDKEYHSVVEMIETPFIFYRSNGVHDGGMDYLDQMKLNDQVTISIEASEDEGISWDDFFNGLIDIQSKQRIDSRKVQYVITRNSLWTKFKSRIDNSVDIKSTTDLDGNSINPINSVILNLTPQKLVQKFYGFQKERVLLQPPGANEFLQFGVDMIDVDEIEDIFHIPTAFNDGESVPWIMASKYDGDFIFNLKFHIIFSNAYSNVLSTWLQCFIQINDEAPIAFSYTESDNDIIFTYSDTLTLKVNDIVRIYVQAQTAPPHVGIIFVEGKDSNADFSIIDIVGTTTFPATESECIFLHDACGAVIDRVVGIEQKFKSYYLGSTQTFYKTYDNDGCGWPFILVRGLQLRQYSLSEKPFSISFKAWWDGINPIANLGLGYETIDGVEVIEVEEKAAFYDDDPILTLSWVNNIVESFDKDYIFNKIKIGYKKWQSEDISGIDDPQTSHEYSTLFETVGKSIDIESDFIAASLAIETTRRTTRILSADYKFDNDTFIIAINPDPLSSPAGDYQPELDENFDSITNLLNPETRYNSTLTPARNLARWGNYLIGCLQDYLSSSIKFNKGEGNFDMIGDYSGSAPGICFNLIADALSEKEDFSLAAYSAGLGHLFTPCIWEFSFPLSYTNYKLLRDNRKRAIAVSESDSGHTICFIKRMEYDIIKSRAKFTVWKK